MAFARHSVSLVILSAAVYVALPVVGVKVVELDSKGEVVDLQPKDLVRKVGKPALAQMEARTTESLDDASESIEDLGLLHEKEMSNSRGELSRTAEENFGWSTSWCYEGRDGRLSSCWKDKPTDAPACTPTSGKSTCTCSEDSDIACNLDFLNDATMTPTTGFCRKRVIYISKGVSQTDAKGRIDVTGRSEERFCSEMHLLDQWKNKKLVAEDADGPESKPKPWHGFCGRGYYSKTVGGKKVCLRGKRFLNEICWGDSSSSGKCVGTEKEFKEYSTSCYKKSGETYGKCMPYAFAGVRSECDCAWAGWNFLLVCSAKNDACSGHACVMSMANGKKYCDYATEQNWQSLR